MIYITFRIWPQESPPRNAKNSKPGVPRSDRKFMLECCGSRTKTRMLKGSMCTFQKQTQAQNLRGKRNA